MDPAPPERSGPQWHWGPPSLLLLLAALAISVPCIKVRAETELPAGGAINLDVNITPWGYSGDALVSEDAELPTGIPPAEATEALRAIDRPGWMAWLVFPTAVGLLLAVFRKRKGAWSGLIGGTLALISLGGTTQHVLDRVDEAEAVLGVPIDVTLAWGFWLGGAVFAATITWSVARLIAFHHARGDEPAPT